MSRDLKIWDLNEKRIVLDISFQLICNRESSVSGKLNRISTIYALKTLKRVTGGGSSTLWPSPSSSVRRIHEQ